jgi:hypothetical protein
MAGLAAQGDGNVMLAQARGDIWCDEKVRHGVPDGSDIRHRPRTALSEALQAIGQAGVSSVEAKYLRRRAVEVFSTAAGPSLQGSSLVIFEEMMAGLAAEHGHAVGLGRLRRLLLQAGRPDLVSRVQAMVRCRRWLAHPDVQLVDEVIRATAAGEDSGDGDDHTGSADSCSKFDQVEVFDIASVADESWFGDVGSCCGDPGDDDVVRHDDMSTQTGATALNMELVDHDGLRSWLHRLAASGAVPPQFWRLLAVVADNGAEEDIAAILQQADEADGKHLYRGITPHVVQARVLVQQCATVTYEDPGQQCEVDVVSCEGVHFEFLFNEGQPSYKPSFTSQVAEVGDVLLEGPVLLHTPLKRLARRHCQQSPVKEGKKKMYEDFKDEVITGAKTLNYGLSDDDGGHDNACNEDDVERPAVGKARSAKDVAGKCLDEVGQQFVSEGGESNDDQFMKETSLPVLSAPGFGASLAVSGTLCGAVAVEEGQGDIGGASCHNDGPQSTTESAPSRAHFEFKQGGCPLGSAGTQVECRRVVDEGGTSSGLEEDGLVKTSGCQFGSVINIIDDELFDFKQGGCPLGSAGTMAEVDQIGSSWVVPDDLEVEGSDEMVNTSSWSTEEKLAWAGKPWLRSAQQLALDGLYRCRCRYHGPVRFGAVCEGCGWSQSQS